MSSPRVTFLEHLRARLDAGGLPTDDLLAACLPLFRQVMDAHEHTQVAPLEDVNLVFVQGTTLWFENGKLAPPRKAADKLAWVQAPAHAAVEVVARKLHTSENAAGALRAADATIGKLGEEVTAPVYLSGYVSWEHQLGHHDQLTDVFVLGLVLASLALGLDLTDPEDLEEFVHNRTNLFAIAPRLNPVVARQVVRMTELDRHHRVQDLAEVVERLAHYREQLPESFTDLSGVRGFSEAPLSGKRQLLQARLRDRLFDVSRRNRLIYHKAGMQSLNLTVSSVPLLLDVRNVRPEHLLTWHGEVAKTLGSGETLALGRYLRFEDAPYLPAALDKIRTDAARDRAELGFAQLRLAICFFRWHNLKEDPKERIHSPLILLPVELARKKGVKDSYTLTPTSTVGEVNPSLRHLLRQLYGLALPESVDLKEADLVEFHRVLQEQIRASEPGITLERIDRPRIELIVERARQRLDQYRRRLRLAGRGVRTLHDVDYCYDRDNFQPLGLALYRTLVRPAPAPLRHLLRERPEPVVQQMTAPPTEPPVKERQLYHLKEGSGENPYSWDFDLCSVTLGNFHTRKMSLVRDYASLLAQDTPHPSFDAVFSLAPPTPAPEPPESDDLSGIFPVVASDPTQSRALVRARSGMSFIIQGPPGTGKSQSITNLIADCVAAGKRVLFVCQKRAAIDVVFHRLKQRGLDELCCLVHDSLADKKEFIRDLKETYQRHLAAAAGEDPAVKRGAVLAEVKRELEPLARFSEAMAAQPQSAGLPLRQLVARVVELREDMRELPPEQACLVPPYRLWLEHGDAVRHLESALAREGGPAVLAERSLRLLNLASLAADRPPRVDELTALDEVMRALESGLAAVGLPRELMQTLGQAGEVLTFAQQVEPLARRSLLDLLNAEHPRARELARAAGELASLREGVEAAAARNTGWREKIPPDELGLVLGTARAVEGSVLGVFKPSWWRLRGVLNARYDFDKHLVKPTWVQVLEALAAEYAKADAYRTAERELGRRLNVDGVDETAELVARVRDRVSGAGPAAWLAGRPPAEAQAAVTALLACGRHQETLEQGLSRWLADDDHRGNTLAGLRDDLSGLTRELAALPRLLSPLLELSRVPPELARAVRRLPLAAAELEAAMARLTAEEVCRRDAPVNAVAGAGLERQVERLARQHREWLALNGRQVLHGVRARFREHVRVSGLAAAQLTPEQKEFKKGYAAGRRELEHEFGKSMRYRSVRDLLGGPAGQVIQDLKPVWLMSPVSVSDILPFDAAHFDVVIFDEASQIPLEEAIPALYRACQMIVVGDEMQLPPTSFFSARAEEDSLVIEEDGAQFAYDLDTDSFFTQAARNLPSTWLGWHYRSRSESLISFSNRSFYQGRLLTVPDAALPHSGAGELRFREPAGVAALVPAVLERPLAFCLVERGVYEKRTNPREAECVAELVRELLARRPELSVGLVAFSEAQQGEIERALAALAAGDAEFAARLEAASEREEDGQFCGLFVKNLENVQGDERDVVILSICYGHDAHGKMLMNFGPINKAGGEKRLNVVFSRAKHHMVVVSSITAPSITNDYNDGASALKTYLAYAEATSRGDGAHAMQLLAGLSARSGAPVSPHDAVATQVAAALESRGYEVDRGLGQSTFRVDLGVRRKGERTYALAVMIDTERFHTEGTALERYLLRPAILKAFGWKLALVLGKEWWEDSAAVLARLIDQLERPEPAPEPEPPEPEPPPPVEEPAPPEPAPIVAPQTTSPPSPPGPTRRFEMTEGAASKYWEVEVAGHLVNVRYGRIGQPPRTTTHTLPDGPSAQREAEKLVASKLRKGYRAV